MKRPFWLGVGAAAGVGGTLWAQREVRRRIGRATSLFAAADGERLSNVVREVGGRVRAAVEAAGVERARREDQLWDTLEARRQGRSPAGGPGALRLVPVRESAGAAHRRDVPAPGALKEARGHRRARR